MSDGDSDRLWIDFGRKKEGEEGTKEGRTSACARCARAPSLSFSLHAKKEGRKEGRKAEQRPGPGPGSVVGLVADGYRRSKAVEGGGSRRKGRRGREGKGRTEGWKAVRCGCVWGALWVGACVRGWVGAYARTAREGSAGGQAAQRRPASCAAAWLLPCCLATDGRTDDDELG